MNPNERLFSLDALRGFDMLFIMGFAGLVSSLCALWPNLFTDALAAQMHHVPWNGLTHHDTIFPLFLFIAGISFPFSLAKQRSKGFSEGRILYRVIRRGVLAFSSLISRRCVWPACWVASAWPGCSRRSSTSIVEPGPGSGSQP